MASRYFTPAEVEALIPALTQIMERVMAAHEEATTLRERHRAEQHRIAMAGGGILDQPRWQAEIRRIEQRTKQVQEALREIGALGGEAKDLGLGLVDFRHLRDGREVNLCWRYGEREIRHWHGLDEGYTSRKPL